MKTIVNKQDNAVAVVIGTLLAFVIISSLMASFILWYVPANGSSNDAKFDTQTETFLLNLQSKLANNSVYPGLQVVQNFNVGIPGTPPFSSNSNTFISFLNESGFHAQLKYYFTLTFTYKGVQKNLIFNHTFNSKGQLYIDTSTPFIPTDLFYFQNDAIVLKQQGSNYSQILNGIPFAVSLNNSKNLSLRASQYSIDGGSASFGGYGSTLLTLEFSNLTQNYFTLGENISVNYNGSYVPVTVTKIKLDSFYYNVSSNLVAAWNNTLALQYGRNSKVFGNSSTGSWDFSPPYPFTVFYNYKDDFLSISLNSTNIPVYPNSLNLDQYSLLMLNI
jgi:hypothetical protein